MSSPPANRRQPRTVQTVHQALSQLADGDEVCATIREIAQIADGATEHLVRRSLASLVEQGQIVPAGKRGKSTVFHLSPSSSGAEPPSRRDSPQGGSSTTTNGRSTAHSDPTPAAKDDNMKGRSRRDSGLSAEDREHLDSFKFTPEVRAAGAALSRALTARYSSRPSPPAVLRRRERLLDERPHRRLPDVSERYFEQGRRSTDIWLPAGVRFPKPAGDGGVKP